MALIGILGGMGPLATVDFMDKVVRLTTASRDQEHLPLLVANLPHIDDRSSAILDHGADPLPALLDGIDLLNRNGVGLIAIPCNSAHHWYAQMSAHSGAPVLHIAQTCVAAVPREARRVAVLATGGALVSGFYQQALADLDIEPMVPNAEMQPLVAACIREVKAGDLDAAGAHLQAVLGLLAEQGVSTALMACTEIPLAAARIAEPAVKLIDSTLELARATVKYACERGWNRAQ
ncbi:cysteate racemase [Paraburkholderia acidisoli]|uniref:Amino acid racemase n=1 Tax=Paraburkholderia acidisoli TaxID=2571748 RepID=A0A7Z2GN50_9BURK|nr:amino acid racemase [Paraburkholderia acidisoli]QGZ64848.1 amino acid racemase [Paraburkholderia acidisoli]